MRDQIRFALLNVQGLVTKRTNKLCSPDVINLFKTNDIVLFTETWTDEFSDLHVDGFEHCALHRLNKHPCAKRNSGGVIVYVRNAFVSNDTFVTCVGDSHNLDKT